MRKDRLKQTDPSPGSIDLARYRDFGFNPGIMAPGPRNAITDVAGVGVGHATVRQGDINTGVTAIIPQPGNLFRNKIAAAVDVINGFGKSAGLVQLAELGLSLIHI